MAASGVVIAALRAAEAMYSSCVEVCSNIMKMLYGILKQVQKLCTESDERVREELKKYGLC
jgi:hypothetical protein